MLYLSELLSVYDGMPPTKWGYHFARNKYGAPISNEIIEEADALCRQGYMVEDSNGYYRIYKKLEYIPVLAKSKVFSWKIKYIDAALNSVLMKPFPQVISAVQFEPGISLLEERKKTSTLLNPNLEKVLFDDFVILKESVEGLSVDLEVPASIWIDYLMEQAN